MHLKKGKVEINADRGSSDISVHLDYDPRVRWPRFRTDEVADAVAVMETADDELPVVGVHVGPHCCGVLSLDEREFLAIRFKHAAFVFFAGSPAGIWIEVVREERVLLGEFVFGEEYVRGFHGGVFHWN